MVRSKVYAIDFGKKIDFEIGILEKWNRLQTIAHNKDECLQENRIQWKHFKRQLDDLEEAAQKFSNINNLRKLNNAFPFVIIFAWLLFVSLLVSRSVHSQADVHLDPVHRLGFAFRRQICMIKYSFDLF